MILMNVSEFDDVSKATDTLISSIQAFKEEDMDIGDFSMDIIDVFNQIGNSYAISTSDLADSLTRSSASLVAANNSLEQAVALTTAANTTIQNPEAVGTTLKTLSMRIRGVKTELEEAGEDTEGMITNTSKLQAKVAALTNVDGKGGVNILTNTGEFKSTYDILLEISKVWKEIGDMDQAALLEIIAGKRAGSVVAGILQNGDILENAYKDALSADGSAMKELNTYLDSIQGRIDLFNNSLQTMWMNFLDTDVVKGIIDLGTALIKVVDNVGLLKAALAAFAAKNAFSSKSGFGNWFDPQTIQSGVQKWVESIKTVKTTANDATKAVMNVKTAQDAEGVSAGAAAVKNTANAAAQTAVGVTAKAASIGVKILNAALTMGLSLFVSDIIGWAAKTWDEFNVTAEELKAKAEEITDTYKTAQKELKDNLESLTISSDTDKYETLLDEFNALKEGVNDLGQNLSLTSDEYERYLDIVDLIVGINPDLADGYDSNAAAIGRNAGALEQLIKMQKESARIEAAKLVSYGAYSENNNFDTLAEQSIAEFNTANKKVGKYVNGDKSIVDMLSDWIWPDYFEITDYGIAETAADDFAQLIMRAIGYDPDKINEILDSYSSDELGFEFDLWASDYTSEIVKNREKIANQLENMDADFLAGRTFQSQKTFVEKVLQDAGYKKKNIKKAIEEYYTDDGTFDFEAFKLGIANEEDGTTYGDILSAYVTNFVESSTNAWDELADSYEDAEKELSAAQQGMIDTFLQVPYALRDYDELSSGEQSFITKWITSSDMFKVDENTTEKQLAEAKQAIISMVRNFADDEFWFMDSNGQKSISASTILDQLFSIDTTDISYGQYVDKIQQNLDMLWNAIGADTNDFGLTDKNALAVQLGFEFVLNNENSAMDKFKKRAQELLKEDKTPEEIQKWINSLKPEVVTRLIEFDWSTYQSDSMSLQDMVNTVSPMPVSSDIQAVSTYSELSEQIEAYNEILAQTNEITADHIEVTQEYKDSLSELGFEEEELIECFGEENDLIVKNSKRLRELVAEKKKAAAADVKLAKSQSRLEYYQLVDELNETLNVKRDLTDAEQEAIDSTLKQLKVVERAIYKYQLLEDSLLGATNAFEDFAQAKEVDALNTYGDSYVEMVQTMYDGIYKTGQVGTEAFWSAVEHLVPITEYAHLTEDADRMQKIISYFNKNIAPTLTLKDDAFSIDFDAVENFVEQGIANGVFNKDGTTGKFNLVEGMNLEEAARLMKMTTAQAYAFFAELDKYNVSGNEQSFLSQLDQSTEGKIMRATTELENLNKQKNALLRSGGYAENRKEIETINDKIKVQTEELEKLGEKSYQAWSNYAKTDSAITALNEIEDKTTTLTKQQAIVLGVEWEENMTVEDALKQLEERKANLEEPTVLTAQLAQEHIQDELTDLEEDLGKDRFVTIKAKVEQDENGVYRVVENSGLSAEDQAFAQKYANLLNANQDIAKFLETGLTTTETYLQSIDGTLKDILSHLGGKSTGEKDNNAGGEGDGDGNNATTNADNSGTESENNVASRKQKPKFVPLLYKDGATLDAHDYSDTGGSVLAHGQPYLDPSTQPGGDLEVEEVKIETKSVTGRISTDPYDAPFTPPAELTPGTSEFKRKQKQLAEQSGGGGGAGPILNEEPYPKTTMRETLLRTPEPTPTPTPPPQEITVDGIEEALSGVAQQIQDEYKQSNVNLLNRPEVSWVDMNAAGWNTPEGSYSTVDTVTFTAGDFGLEGKDGTDYAINVTPILPDGTVIEGGVDGLWQYINDELSQGNQLEDLDIFLGSYESIEKAVAAATRLHELQEAYYGMHEQPDETVTTDPLAEALLYKQQMAAGKVTRDTTTGAVTSDETDTTIVNAENVEVSGQDFGEWATITDFGELHEVRTQQDAYEDVRKYLSAVTALNEFDKYMHSDPSGRAPSPNTMFSASEAARFGIEIDEDEFISLREIAKELMDLKKQLEEPTQVTITKAVSEIDQQMQDLQAVIKSQNFTEIDPVTLGLEIDATPEEIKASVEAKLVQLRLDKAMMSILCGVELSEEDKIELQQELILLNSFLFDDKTVNINVDGSDAAEQALKDVNGLTGDVTKTVTTEYVTKYKTVGGNTVRTPGSGGRYIETTAVDVNGTAHAQGTANNGGSWGAPKSETALVGELGPELRVRGNQWSLLGENGAEFNEVKKGDINK